MNVRTKIMVALCISTVMVNSSFRLAFPWLIIILNLIPLIWLICLKRYKVAAFYVIAYLLSLTYQTEIVFLQNILNYVPYIILMMMAIFHYMLPGFAMAFIIFTTTSVQEYINAMSRMRIPMAFTIATSVLFRFMPTVKAERIGINRAVKMRGITKARFIKQPLQTFSFVIIPLLNCSVRIGDELSMASLCRGLSLNQERTVRPEDQLKIWDWLVIIISLLILLMFVFNLNGMRFLFQT